MTMFESRRQNKNNCEVQTFVSTEKSRNESLKIATAAAGGRDVSGSTVNKTQPAERSDHYLET